MDPGAGIRGNFVRAESHVRLAVQKVHNCRRRGGVLGQFLSGGKAEQYYFKSVVLKMVLLKVPSAGGSTCLAKSAKRVCGIAIVVPQSRFLGDNRNRSQLLEVAACIDSMASP